MNYYDYLDKIRNLKEQLRQTDIDMIKRSYDYPVRCDVCKLDFKLNEIYYELTAETFTRGVPYQTLHDRVMIHLCCPKCLKYLDMTTTPPDVCPVWSVHYFERSTRKFKTTLPEKVCIKKYEPTKFTQDIRNFFFTHKPEEAEKLFKDIRRKFFTMKTSEIIKKYKLK